MMDGGRFLDLYGIIWEKAGFIASGALAAPARARTGSHGGNAPARSRRFRAGVVPRVDVAHGPAIDFPRLLRLPPRDAREEKNKEGAGAGRAGARGGGGGGGKGQWQRRGGEVRWGGGGGTGRWQWRGGGGRGGEGGGGGARDARKHGPRYGEPPAPLASVATHVQAETSEFSTARPPLLTCPLQTSAPWAPRPRGLG